MRENRRVELVQNLTSELEDMIEIFISEWEEFRDFRDGLTNISNMAEITSMSLENLNKNKIITNILKHKAIKNVLRRMEGEGL